MIWPRVSLAAAAGVGAFAEQLEGVDRIEILERLPGCREVLAQWLSQPLGMVGAFPDRCLVRPGNHFDRLGLGAATGRSGWESVRTTARTCVSAASLLAPEPLALPQTNRPQLRLRRTLRDSVVELDHRRG